MFENRCLHRMCLELDSQGANHYKRLHSGVVVSTVTSQQEGIWCYLSWGIYVLSLHVHPVHEWVLSGYSDFLPRCNHMHVEDSKLTSGVSLSVLIWVGLARMYPVSHPMATGIDSSLLPRNYEVYCLYSGVKFLYFKHTINQVMELWSPQACKNMMNV